MYDDLLGEKTNKPKPKPEPEKKIKAAKWSIEEYEKQAYCYQCSNTSFTCIKDKMTQGHLVKRIQCNTCFSEWTEVWDQNGNLVGLSFKF